MSILQLDSAFKMAKIGIYTINWGAPNYYDTDGSSINAMILTIKKTESSGICTTYCTGLIGSRPINPVQYV